jgi:kynurenine formamidase
MKVIDLTLKVTPRIKVFPGSPQPSFIPWANFGAHGYDMELVHMSTHTGTHMDAPSHFVPGGPAVDMIATGRLVSPAILIRARKRAGQTIGRSEIEKHEIRRGDTVVLATGWEKRYGSRNYMTENPGLSKDGAEYLVEKKVNAVAIDSPSIDPDFDEKFTAHRVLLKAGIIIIENLCNLDSITEERFTLVAAPLKLVGASGSPVRALALL